MKKLMQTQLTTGTLVNRSILTLVLVAAAMTLYSAADFNPNDNVFGIASFMHVSATTGLFLSVVALTMVLHRPAQLYSAGSLGALVLVTFTCTVLQVRLPFSEAIFPNIAMGYDYPGYNVQAAFLSYSFAILFKNRRLCMFTGLIGVSALVGQVFDLPLLYGNFAKSHAGMSTFEASLVVLMTVRLMHNYFGDFDFRKYIPTFTKLADWFLERSHSHAKSTP